MTEVYIDFWRFLYLYGNSFPRVAKKKKAYISISFSIVANVVKIKLTRISDDSLYDISISVCDISPFLIWGRPSTNEFTHAYQ